MTEHQKAVIAKNGQQDIYFNLSMANRHGLISGATGTGKSITMQKVAELFSVNGIPVLVVDVKGDLSGLAQPGKMNEKLQKRLQNIGVTDWNARKNPVQLWDVFAKNGLPFRSTISDMGPLLLSRLLNLNDVQSSVLQLVFKIADDKNLLLIDIKDLRSILQFTSENSARFQAQYGNISSASIGAIQRGLLALEQDGGNLFFAEPMLAIQDLMQIDQNNVGTINILEAQELYLKPAMYATTLLWLLSELFEQLPEVGDQPIPKLVLFLDEAHLLFKDTPKALTDKIEQVVRLIRSKGVGVYFASQNPLDIPDNILGQLGNKIQHALRAFTPKDQKVIKAVAQTMRENPAINTEEAITTLETGEALISFLDEKGAPSIVQKGFIIAPESQMGALTDSERSQLVSQSTLYARYADTIDRESAFELLNAQATSSAQKQQKNAEKETATPQEPANPPQQRENSGFLGSIEELLFGSTGPRGGKKDGLVQTAAKTATRQLSNQIVRGILGSIIGGRKR